MIVSTVSKEEIIFGDNLYEAKKTILSDNQIHDGHRELLKNLFDKHCMPYCIILYYIVLYRIVMFALLCVIFPYIDLPKVGLRSKLTIKISTSDYNHYN